MYCSAPPFDADKLQISKFTLARRTLARLWNQKKYNELILGVNLNKFELEYVFIIKIIIQTIAPILHHVQRDLISAGFGWKPVQLKTSYYQQFLTLLFISCLDWEAKKWVEWSRLTAPVHQLLSFQFIDGGLWWVIPHAPSSITFKSFIFSDRTTGFYLGFFGLVNGHLSWAKWGGMDSTVTGTLSLGNPIAVTVFFLVYITHTIRIYYSRGKV